MTTQYLFFTGGFDSTYLLCDLVINQRVQVQPVYFNCNIDNLPSESFKRRSKKKEVQTIHNIIDALHSKFPHTKELIKPVQIITEIPVIGKQIIDAYNKTKVGRWTNQYLYLAQHCVDNELFDPKPYVAAVQGDQLCRRRVSAIGEYFQLPLCNISKTEMLERATQSGFRDILEASWTCWFPNKDGLQCKRCFACSHRII
jgi:7-cyano-7-deazaguanine synthase in queuosine biosynthesis